MNTIEYEVKKLDTGLEIVFLPAPGAKVTALQLWMKTGSFDEEEAESGMAHMVEHMLFKGTTKRTVGAMAMDVEAAGGDLNAWTSFDETVYHLVLPEGEVELGLDVLSDAVAHSLFDEHELEQERKVVLEEIRRSKDSPVKTAQDSLFSALYRSHPYGRPILGREETVSAFTRQDLVNFVSRHYVPSRAMLVLSGNLDGVDLEKVERFFGDWRGEGDARKKPPGVPPLESSDCSILGMPITEGHLYLSFMGPSAYDGQAVEADVLTTVLGLGESSRLARRLKRGQCVANDAISFAFTPRDSGLIMMGLTLPPEKIMEAAEAIGRELGRLLDKGVSSSELARARRMIESDIVFQEETAEGRARKAGYYSAILGDPSLERKYLDRLASLGPDQVMELAEACLAGKHFKAAVVLPKQAVDSVSPREIAVRIGNPIYKSKVKTHAPRTRQTRRRQVHTYDIRNDIRLLVQVDRTAPVASVRLVMPGGLLWENQKNNGFHNLASSLLTRGTAARDGDSLAASIESLGGVVGGFSGRNSVGMRGEFLSSTLAECMSLLTECLLTPAFEEHEVRMEVDRVIEAIKHRDDNPANKAFRLFREALYGNHPYSMDVLGTPDNLKAMSGHRLREDYDEALSRAMTIAVVGDVDPDHVMELAQAVAVRKPESSEQGTKPPLEVKAPSERVVLRRRFDREQTHIVLGFKGASLLERKKYELEVLAGILGGQSGRLFMDLRDRQGLAYAVSAFSIEAVAPGYFALYIACSPEKVEQALTGLEEHTRRLMQDPVSEAELQRVKRFLIGNREIDRQRASTKAADLAFDSAYELGEYSSSFYEERIRAVTAEDLLERARNDLDLEKSITVVLGPSEPEE